MKLFTIKIKIKDRDLIVFYPENDDTIFGTLECIKNNKFHFDKINLNNNVFVDIGCNIGVVSMVAATLYPNSKVYSFDASELAINCLRLSCAVNGILNINPYNLAVGDKNEKVRFYSNSKEFSCLVEEGLNSSNPTYDSETQKIKIDEIFESPLLGLDKIKLLKMDIEGGEFSIFKHLFSNRPDLLARIENLHLEIHQYLEFEPEKLKADIMKFFGEKVCFDT